MSKVKFDDIIEAFDFVSSGPCGEHSALLDRSAGKIHWYSEFGDFDEIPEELWESDDTISIPHKNDLELGTELVFDYVRKRIPDDYSEVREFFSRRGAYARFKDHLDSKGLLQDWYDYEQKAQKAALRAWCDDNGIELADS